MAGGGRGRSHDVCGEEALVMVMPWLNPRDLASLACTCGFLARAASHLHHARCTDIARGLERWKVPAINAVDHHLYPRLTSYCVSSFRPPPHLRHPLQPWGSPVYTTTTHLQGRHDDSQSPEQSQHCPYRHPELCVDADALIDVATSITPSKDSCQTCPLGDDGCSGCFASGHDQGIMRALGPDNGMLKDNPHDCSQHGACSASTDHTYNGNGHRALDCRHVNARSVSDSETKKSSSSGDNGHHQIPNTNKSHDVTHQVAKICYHTCNNIITNQKSAVFRPKGNAHHCAGSSVNNHGDNNASRASNIEKRNCICMEQSHSKNRYSRGSAQLQGHQTSLCGHTLDGNVAYDEESRLHCLSKPDNLQTENSSGMMMCILECGPLCACDDRCKYRVTQHGLSVKVAVVRHPHKGWGLHSSQCISRGSFICEYAGELLTIMEAKSRQALYDARQQSEKTFVPALLVIKEHLPSGQSCLRWNLDATNAGNVARFINHACDGGNLFPCLIRQAGTIVPRLVFFASKDIMEGEELTFSYGEAQDNVQAHLCYCGTDNCKGFMPFEDT